MCKPTQDGYKLNSGKELKVTSLHPDELPEQVRNELDKSPASQLDILYLRTNMHRNAQNIDTIQATLVNIDASLSQLTETFSNQLQVEVVNGKKEVRPITELIAELWEMHKDQRDIPVIRKFFYRNRVKFSVAAVIFLVVNLLFREQLHQLIDWIAENIFHIIKWLF